MPARGECDGLPLKECGNDTNHQKSRKLSLNDGGGVDGGGDVVRSGRHHVDHSSASAASSSSSAGGVASTPNAASASSSSFVEVYRRGRRLLDQTRFADARDAFDECLRMGRDADADVPDAAPGTAHPKALVHNGIALIHIANGKFEHAAKEAGRALDYMPDFADAEASLATAYLRLGKGELAQELFASALKGTNPSLDEKRRSYVEAELRLLDEEKDDDSLSSDDKSEELFKLKDFSHTSSASVSTSASASASASTVVPSVSKVLQNIAARTHRIAQGFFGSEHDEGAADDNGDESDSMVIDDGDDLESGRRAKDNDTEAEAEAPSQEEIAEWQPRRAELLAEAEGHKRRGDLKSAVVPLTAIIVEGGRCVGAADYEARAQVYTDLKSHERAVEDYVSALSVAERELKRGRNRANEKAAERYRSRVWHSSRESAFQTIRKHMYMQDWNAALHTIHDEIRVYQNDPDADIYHSPDEQAQLLARLFCQRGICHENRGYLEKAQNDLQEARKKEVDAVEETLLALVRVLKKRGHDEEVAALLEEGAELFPKSETIAREINLVAYYKQSRAANVDYLLMQVKHFLAISQSEVALEKVNELLQINDKHVEALYLKSRICHRNEPSEALRAIERAQNFATIAELRNLPIYHQMGVMYLQLEDPEKAVRFLTKARDAQQIGTDFTQHLQVAKAQHAQRVGASTGTGTGGAMFDPQREEDSLESSFAAAKERQHRLQKKADAAMSKRDFAAAVDLYSKCFDVNIHTGLFRTIPLMWYINRGYAYVHLGKYDEAIDDAKSGLRLYETSALYRTIAPQSDDDRNGLLSHAKRLRQLLTHASMNKPAKDDKAQLRGGKGLTQLMQAALAGTERTVETVVRKIRKKSGKRNNEIDRTCPEGNSALWYAAREGHTKVVEMLLDADANVNVSNESRITPLMVAISEKHTSIVKLLLDRRLGGNSAEADSALDLRAKNLSDQTALDLALSLRVVAIVKLLLDAGKQRGLDSLTMSGTTRAPLIAALAPDSSRDRKSYESASSSSSSSKKADQPVHIVKLLIQHGASINTIAPRGSGGTRSPVYLALEHGHDDVLELFMKEFPPEAQREFRARLEDSSHEVLDHLKPEQIFRNYKKLNRSVTDDMYRIPAMSQFLKTNEAGSSPTAAGTAAAAAASPIEEEESESKEAAASGAEAAASATAAAAGGAGAEVVAFEWDTERLKRDYRNFKNRRAQEIRQQSARELSTAVAKLNVECVRWLLEGGVPPNDSLPKDHALVAAVCKYKEKKDGASMSEADRKTHIEVISLLADHGSDPHKKNHASGDAYFYAGDDAELKAILDRAAKNFVSRTRNQKKRQRKKEARRKAQMAKDFEASEQRKLESDAAAARLRQEQEQQAQQSPTVVDGVTDEAKEDAEASAPSPTKEAASAGADSAGDDEAGVDEMTPLLPKATDAEFNEQRVSRDYGSRLETEEKEDSEQAATGEGVEEAVASVGHGQKPAESEASSAPEAAAKDAASEEVAAPAVDHQPKSRKARKRAKKRAGGAKGARADTALASPVPAAEDTKKAEGGPQVPSAAVAPNGAFHFGSVALLEADEETQMAAAMAASTADEWTTVSKVKERGAKAAAPKAHGQPNTRFDYHHARSGSHHAPPRNGSTPAHVTSRKPWQNGDSSRDFGGRGRGVYQNKNYRPGARTRAASQTYQRGAAGAAAAAGRGNQNNYRANGFQQRGSMPAQRLATTNGSPKVVVATPASPTNVAHVSVTPTNKRPPSYGGGGGSSSSNNVAGRRRQSSMNSSNVSSSSSSAKATAAAEPDDGLDYSSVSEKSNAPPVPKSTDVDDGLDFHSNGQVAAKAAKAVEPQKPKALNWSAIASGRSRSTSSVAQNIAVRTAQPMTSPRNATARPVKQLPVVAAAATAADQAKRGTRSPNAPAAAVRAKQQQQSAVATSPRRRSPSETTTPTADVAAASQTTPRASPSPKAAAAGGNRQRVKRTPSVVAATPTPTAGDTPAGSGGNYAATSPPRTYASLLSTVVRQPPSQHQQPPVHTPSNASPTARAPPSRDQSKGTPSPPPSCRAGAANDVDASEREGEQSPRGGRPVENGVVVEGSVDAGSQRRPRIRSDSADLSNPEEASTSDAEQAAAARGDENADRRNSEQPGALPVSGNVPGGANSASEAHQPPGLANDSDERDANVNFSVNVPQHVHENVAAQDIQVSPVANSDVPTSSPMPPPSAWQHPPQVPQQQQQRAAGTSPPVDASTLPSPQVTTDQVFPPSQHVQHAVQSQSSQAPVQTPPRPTTGVPYVQQVPPQHMYQGPPMSSPHNYSMPPQGQHPVHFQQLPQQFAPSQPQAQLSQESSRPPHMSRPLSAAASVFVPPQQSTPSPQSASSRPRQFSFPPGPGAQNMNTFVHPPRFSQAQGVPPNAAPGQQMPMGGPMVNAPFPHGQFQRPGPGMPQGMMQPPPPQMFPPVSMLSPSNPQMMPLQFGSMPTQQVAVDGHAALVSCPMHGAPLPMQQQQQQSPVSSPSPRSAVTLSRDAPVFSPSGSTENTPRASLSHSQSAAQEVDADVDAAAAAVSTSVDVAGDVDVSREDAYEVEQPPVMEESVGTQTEESIGTQTSPGLGSGSAWTSQSSLSSTSSEDSSDTQAAEELQDERKTEIEKPSAAGEEKAETSVVEFEVNDSRSPTGNFEDEQVDGEVYDDAASPVDANVAAADVPVSEGEDASKLVPPPQPQGRQHEEVAAAEASRAPPPSVVVESGAGVPLGASGSPTSTFKFSKNAAAFVPRRSFSGPPPVMNGVPMFAPGGIMPPPQQLYHHPQQQQQPPFHAAGMMPMPPQHMLMYNQQVAAAAAAAQRMPMYPPQQFQMMHGGANYMVQSYPQMASASQPSAGGPAQLPPQGPYPHVNRQASFPTQVPQQQQFMPPQPQVPRAQSMPQPQPQVPHMYSALPQQHMNGINPPPQQQTAPSMRPATGPGQGMPQQPQVQMQQSVPQNPQQQQQAGPPVQLNGAGGMVPPNASGGGARPQQQHGFPAQVFATSAMSGTTPMMLSSLQAPPQVAFAPPPQQQMQRQGSPPPTHAPAPPQVSRPPQTQQPVSAAPAPMFNGQHTTIHAPTIPQQQQQQQSAAPSDATAPVAVHQQPQEPQPQPPTGSDMVPQPQVQSGDSVVQVPESEAA